MGRKPKPFFSLSSRDQGSSLLRKTTANTVFQEMAQSLKCLLCKHENPGLAPQHAFKSQVCWCSFILIAQGQMETEGCLGLAESVS